MVFGRKGKTIRQEKLNTESSGDVTSSSSSSSLSNDVVNSSRYDAIVQQLQQQRQKQKQKPLPPPPPSSSMLHHHQIMKNPSSAIIVTMDHDNKKENDTTIPTTKKSKKKSSSHTSIILDGNAATDSMICGNESIEVEVMIDTDDTDFGIGSISSSSKSYKSRISRTKKTKTNAKRGHAKQKQDRNQRRRYTILLIVAVSTILLVSAVVLLLLLILGNNNLRNNTATQTQLADLAMLMEKDNYSEEIEIKQDEASSSSSLSSEIGNNNNNADNNDDDNNIIVVGQFILPTTAPTSTPIFENNGIVTPSSLWDDSTTTIKPMLDDINDVPSISRDDSTTVPMVVVAELSRPPTTVNPTPQPTTGNPTSVLTTSLKLIETENATTSEPTILQATVTPTFQPTTSQPTTLNPTIAPIEDIDWSNGCPDDESIVTAVVSPSNNNDCNARRTSLVLIQYCIASKRDGDWYWIRSNATNTDDTDNNDYYYDDNTAPEGRREYDSWEYINDDGIITNDQEQHRTGQKVVTDIRRSGNDGKYLVSLVRDSMLPYDIITTHEFIIPAESSC